MNHPFQVGDRVEYTGPETHPTNARPGEYGRIVTSGAVGDPPPDWVVDFQRVIGVYAASDLRPAELGFEVRKVDPARPDRARMAEFLEERAAARVVRLGEIVDATQRDALIAEKDGRIVGVLTYMIEIDECEILSLHVTEQWIGIGSALLREVEWLAEGADCWRLWLITTNDNLDALRFYQRRRFRLAKLYPGAVNESRRMLKPEIPPLGEHGISLRDEIELQMFLRPDPKQGVVPRDPPKKPS